MSERGNSDHVRRYPNSQSHSGHERFDVGLNNGVELQHQQAAVTSSPLRSELQGHFVNHGLPSAPNSQGKECSQRAQLDCASTSQRELVQARTTPHVDNYLRDEFPLPVAGSQLSESVLPGLFGGNENRK